MLFVMLLLIGLQFFILFLAELKNLGHGNYDLITAAQVIVLKLPKEIHRMFPIIALIGVLVGLGTMAANSELVVMRASGLSVLNIAQTISYVALFLMIVMFLLGELVIPSLSRRADEIKLSAISSGQSIRTNQGLWMRDGRNFIYIGEVLPEQRQLHQVISFNFDASKRLKTIITMNQVNWHDEQWYASQSIQQHFKNDKITKLIFNDWVWPTHLSDSILTMSSVLPEDMPLKQLYTLIQIHKKLHQSSTKLEVALYQRLVQPFSTLVMMLLGVPFIFGPLRSSTMGAKLLLGIGVGFGFYVIHHFFVSFSQVYQLPPLYSVLTPTLIFAAWSWFALKRTW